MPKFSKLNMPASALVAVFLAGAGPASDCPKCCTGGQTVSATVSSTVSFTEPAAEAAPATQPANKAAELFAKLQGLVGTYESQPMNGQKCEVEYSLTGGGTAVVEVIKEMHGGMTTVYTLDKDRVLMTHYCAVGNQPRMASAGLNGDTAEFKFVDITGLKDPAGPHMHDLTLKFVGDGKLNANWQLYVDAKPAMSANFELTKVK